MVKEVVYVVLDVDVKSTNIEGNCTSCSCFKHTCKGNRR